MLAVVVVLFYGGFRVWMILFPGDEAEIRTMLDDLSAAASFRPSDKPLTHMAKAGELAGFFTEDVEIRAEGPRGEMRRIQGKASLQQIAVSAQSMGSGLTLGFKDVLVAVKEGQGQASCRLTMIANGLGEPTPWVQILAIDVVETDRGWKVADVEAVEAVERVD
jgi:hypothetical protein